MMPRRLTRKTLTGLLIRTCLKERRWKGGGRHVQLDLRREGLNGRRLKLRDPEDPQWPKRGRDPTDIHEAINWIHEYVERLGVDWFTGEADVPQTVEECGEAYREELLKTKGPQSSTYRNRRSHLRNHIYPALGEELLAGLSVERVQGLLDGMTRADGKPAGVSLKDGVYRTLCVLWRTNRGNTPPWSNKVQISHEGDANLDRTRRAWAGELEQYDTGFTDAELRRILVAARKVDLESARNPKIHIGFNLRAPLTATLIYNPLRIQEATFYRREAVCHELGALRTLGTKTRASAYRVLPIQDAYWPWVELLLARPGSPRDFLIPTSDAARRPGVSTYQGWTKRALETAGLKRAGDLTHVFRGANLSRARAAGLMTPVIMRLAGHTNPKERILEDHYLQDRSFISGLPPIARSYMPDLGDPEWVTEQAEHWIRTGKCPL